MSIYRMVNLGLRLQTTQPTRGGLTNRCVNYVDLSCRQQWGPDLPFFCASRLCGSGGWLALLLIKAGYVETNPGPTTTRKQVWIYDICHRQMHDMKQISIRCNRIKHWVYLRCTGIRLTQYTDTLPSTCHLHK